MAQRGRVFLAPHQPGHPKELWVHFPNTWGLTRVYFLGGNRPPPYYDAMSAAIGAAEYHKLVKEMQELLDRAAREAGQKCYPKDICQAIGTCPMSLGICSCLWLWKSMQVGSAAKELVASCGSNKVRLVFVRSNSSYYGDDSGAIDDMGKHPAMFYSGYGISPVWPPQGYHLVLTVSESAHWPPPLSAQEQVELAQQAPKDVFLPAPGQATMAQGIGAAQVAPEPDVETRLLKLQTLKDKGLVTEAEYQQKRKEILDDM